MNAKTHHVKPHDLIEVSHPERLLEPALLESRGGFLWWYVDLIDEHGSGAVLIWAYGLPFLPGLASAARAGKPTPPGARPSLNLCVYERGRLVNYLLQEYSPDEATWQPEDADGLTSWRFGQTQITRQRREGFVGLDASIDCAVPGTSHRLRGHLRLQGVARQPQPGARQDGPAPWHDWTPLMGPARGALELRLADVLTRVQGRAYHDRNGASSPLHELGFRRWVWGRVPFEDHERIYYVLWPQQAHLPPVSLGLQIDESGQTRQLQGLELRQDEPSRSLMGGLAYDRRVELFDQGKLWMDVRVRSLVDQGPFYLRQLLDARLPSGQRALGLGELCLPAQVDRDLHRPLVRMRVLQDVDGAANSIWSPLFSGPVQGRASRLIRHMIGQRASS